MQVIGKQKMLEAIIHSDYPATDTAKLAEKLFLTKKALVQQAHKLGVKKCPAFKKLNRSVSMENAHSDGLYLTSKRYICGAGNRKISELEDSIKALNAAGQTMLANLTSGIIERIRAAGGKELKFDFLIIRDER